MQTKQQNQNLQNKIFDLKRKETFYSRKKSLNDLTTKKRESGRVRRWSEAKIIWNHQDWGVTMEMKLGEAICSHLWDYKLLWWYHLPHKRGWSDGEGDGKKVKNNFASSPVFYHKSRWDDSQIDSCNLKWKFLNVRPSIRFSVSFHFLFGNQCDKVLINKKRKNICIFAACWGLGCWGNSLRFSVNLSLANEVYDYLQ